MTGQTLADAVARTLVQRELFLGTVECGVNGAVSRAIFDAPEGPDALGSSLVVDQVEKAIELLDLPRPQFQKAGEFSAKAARAAAREARAFLGVDLCLAVWARPPLVEGQTVHLALATGEDVISRTLRLEGRGEEEVRRLTERALRMVRQALG
jgi:nicotinamide mononucleotide (NMN) deamidase PncC